MKSASAQSSRVVLISGGSRGLGAGLVDQFLSEGDRIVTFSRRSTERVEAWRGDPKVRDRFHFSEIDATDRDGCKNLINEISEKWGNVQVLVNNAGMAIDALLLILKDDDVDKLIELDLKSVIFLTKRVVRPMLLGNSGRIINISSVVGLRGYRGLSVYGAAKAGLDGFTRALAREVGVRGVTVNSVAPGYLRTEMTHGLDDEHMNQIVRRTPMGRLGEVEDVAHLVSFLASDRAGFITGQTLVVDGGITN
jgi:3-oxoacyl-[acyl-carrier protein] reductase